MAVWLGVDVGGNRKRFDVALIDEHALLDRWARLDSDEVVSLVREKRPTVVAIDSPCSCAPAGHKSREGERKLNKAVCGIRWTPDETKVQSGATYYGWVVEGLRLYEALASSGAEVIEVFPTASWTRWLGKVGSKSRATWTREGMNMLKLANLPKRTNQDERDAIAAAVTARLHTLGKTERSKTSSCPADDDRGASPAPP